MANMFKRLAAGGFTSQILIGAIICGGLISQFLPTTGQWLNQQVDYTLLLLVGLLFFGVRFNALSRVTQSLPFFTIALLANFVLVPLIGYGVASLFLSAHPLFLVGLVIYFMAPCTDWFLSFTKLAKGDVALGTVLIPINMVIQLLLYPFYLEWFTQNSVQIDAAVVGNALLQWFLVPFVIAACAHYLLRYLLKPDTFEAMLDKADTASMWLTALLVFQVFAGNFATTLDHIAVLHWVFIAVVVYFILTFVLTEGLSYFCRLAYPKRALLTMTVASRNAPMMLAVTMAVLPEQPLVYAALVIGMLVEIPHLTVLRYILLRKREPRSIKPRRATA